MNKSIVPIFLVALCLTHSASAAQGDFFSFFTGNDPVPTEENSTDQNTSEQGGSGEILGENEQAELGDTNQDTTPAGETNQNTPGQSEIGEEVTVEDQGTPEQDNAEEEPVELSPAEEQADAEVEGAVEESITEVEGEVDPEVEGEVEESITGVEEEPVVAEEEDDCLENAEPCPEGEMTPECLAKLCKRLKVVSEDWKVTLAARKDCESGDRNGLLQAIKNCENRTAEAKKTIKSLKDQIKALKKDLKDLEDEESKLKAKSKGLADEIDELEKLVGEKTQRKEKKVTEVNTWSEKVSKLRIELTTLSERYSELMVESSKVTSESLKKRIRLTNEMHKTVNAIEESLREEFPMLEIELEGGSETKTTETTTTNKSAELTIEASRHKTQTEH